MVLQLVGWSEAKHSLSQHVSKSSTGPKILRDVCVTPSAMENGRNFMDWIHLA